MAEPCGSVVYAHRGVTLPKNPPQNTSASSSSSLTYGLLQRLIRDLFCWCSLKGREKQRGLNTQHRTRFWGQSIPEAALGLRSGTKTQPSLKGQGAPGNLYFSSAFSGWTTLALHLPWLRNTHARKIKICHQKKQCETLPAVHAGIHQHPEGISSGKRGFSAPQLAARPKRAELYTPELTASQTCSQNEEF